ncbi:hypothetical protein DB347_04550 [Opitutaceae bacterium EW11]|nr:hypothetical protein DB347_04550 [Opitutaceae bacterium EW11]
MPADPVSPLHGPVLFFDGECGLCQRAVRFLLRRDPAGRIRFAALQGPTAQRFLRERGLPRRDFESMIWVPDWENRTRVPPLFRTDGALAALAELPGPWRHAARLRALPAGLRDRGYGWIARIRFRVFGPPKPHALDRPEWEGRFLP